MPKSRLASIAILGGIFLGAQAATAQIGAMGGLGSAEGSYCKFKKKDVIEADTWLPTNVSADYIEGMTLRRLAEMAYSKGVAAFVVVKRTSCGILLINQRPTSAICRLQARLERSDQAPGEPAPAGERHVVAEVLARTKAAAPSYPKRTGLLNYRNECVIDDNLG